MPCSGNLFAVQLGMLCALSIAYGTNGDLKNLPPDVVLSSSGGNMAAYTALASDWCRERILHNLNLYSSEAFLSNWSDSSPSWFFIPFSKSVFRQGYGFRPLFRHLFSGKQLSASRTEIWSGTFHRKTAQHRLFTNVSEERAKLKPFVSLVEVGNLSRALHLGSDISPVYADGDIDLVADVCQASASIPWVIKPTLIRGEEYTDGGNMYASPLSSLDGAVFALSKGGNALKMFYLSPTNMSEMREAENTLLSDLYTLVFSSLTGDIRLMISLIMRLGCVSEIPSMKHNIDAIALAALIKELDESGDHYAILLSPGKDQGWSSVDLTNLCPEAIRYVISKVECDICTFVWRAKRDITP